MAEMIYSLPSEIKTEIFSQLPIHSIIQWKCVCKPWRSLIDELLNDPSFYYTHTRRLLSSSPSPPPPPAAPSYISFLARKKFSNCRNQFDITGDDNDNEWKMGGSKFSKRRNQVHIIGDDSTDNDWNIVSSCNGLICLVKNHNGWPSFNVYICNPFTREYVNLPSQFDLQRLPPWQKNGLIIANGFGYHPCTKEYKFVRINYDLRTIYVSVYILGSGTWSIKEFLEDYSHPLLWCFESKAAAAGLLFNGALYWSIPPYNTIMSFDLETEEYKIVPSPPQLHENGDDIWVLGECFCVVRKKGTEKEIWVMNKEEEDYSWTMKFRIKPALNITPFVQEEKILLNYDYMKFARYDPKTTTHDHHLNTNTMNSQMVDCWFEILLPYMSRFEMIPYMRSLVSLRALGESADAVGKMKRKRKRESVDICADWLESIFPDRSSSKT